MAFLASDLHWPMWTRLGRGCGVLPGRNARDHLEQGESGNPKTADQFLFPFRFNFETSAHMHKSVQGMASFQFVRSVACNALARSRFVKQHKFSSNRPGGFVAILATRVAVRSLQTK